MTSPAAPAPITATLSAGGDAVLVLTVAARLMSLLVWNRDFCSAEIILVFVVKELMD